MNRNLLYAIFLFLSWTFSYSLGNLMLVVIILYKNKWKTQANQINYLLIFLSILSFINIIIGFNTEKLLNENSSNLQLFIPYLSLLIGAYIIGNQLNYHIIKYLIYFTSFECIIIGGQFLLGATGFWYNSYEINDFIPDLLYYRRPNGFSTNSSVVAQKLLISIWFLMSSKKLVWKKNKSLLAILCLGLVLTFNRTVILTLILSYFLYSNSFRLKHKIITAIFITLFSLLFINTIKFQLFRGSNEVQLESFSRYSIFENGLRYISNHPYLGNNSIKYFYEENERQYHLHNSYLQTAASNGLPIFIGLIYLLGLLFKKRNFFIFPLIIYSIFQFGIFWGLSFLDIALFYNEKNDK